MTFDFGDIREVDDNIPDDLESASVGSTGIFRIVRLGYFTPPEWKTKAAVERGETPPDRMFLQALEPLDFAWDTDPTSMIFQSQGNYSVTWANYRDKRGRFINPNSPFGDIKAAYERLGFSIKDNDACRVLVGKVVQVLSSPKVYVPMKDEEKVGLTEEEVAREMRRRGVWTDKPIAIMDDDWKYTGNLPLPTRKRGYPAGSDSAATRVDAAREAVDAPKLVAALEGKNKAAWVSSLVMAGLEEPYISWAANNQGSELIRQMGRFGLVIEDDKFIKAQA